MAGLYLHIPFCERKCIYCNFYSIEVLDGTERFIDVLVREIEMRADELAADDRAPDRYRTVFFGGGTPSLLSPEQLERIMTPLRSRFAIAPDAEITMECNPGALTKSWLQGYHDLGVNRLSFGVQSFDDEELRFLSRIHTADEARASIKAARDVFENVSLDLIFALPNQTPDRWRANLNEGVDLGTQHFSAYSLVFEEGTKLNAMRLAGHVAPAPDGLEADMYCETMETLAVRGFEQYEVSNYARPGRECRHNVGYWERSTYVSFGPSAHAFLRGDRVSTRWANVSSLTSYLGTVEDGRLPVTSSETLTRAQIVEEIIFLGLRSGGVMLDEFFAVAGVPLEEAASADVAAIVDGGYGTVEAGRLRLGARGYPFADRLALRMIAAVEKALPDVMSGGAEADASGVRLPTLNVL